MNDWWCINNGDACGAVNNSVGEVQFQFSLDPFGQTRDQTIQFPGPNSKLKLKLIETIWGGVDLGSNSV